MYIEFIIIYVMLAIILVLLVGVLVLLLKNGKKDNYNVSNTVSLPVTTSQSANTKATTQAPQQAAGGVVFCKKCAKTYSPDQNFCPNCGTPRN